MIEIGILDKLFRKKEEKRETDVNDWKTVYSFENGYDPSAYTDIKESTYFSCLKIISESIAKCNLEIKQETNSGEVAAREHYLYDLLRLRPNPYMSAIDCYKTFIALAKHKGVSGLLIQRNSSKINALYPVKLTQCTIDDVGLIESDKNNKILWDWEGAESEIGSSFDKDIIVLKEFTLDGIKGKSTKNIVNQSIDTSIKSQGYLNKLFSNGLTNKIAVQLVSDIKDESEIKKIQNKFNRIYGANERIFTIPAGYKVSPLEIKLSDAQFTELRKLSKEEIATSMGVPLSKLNIKADNAKSNENDNLDFLCDCLQVIMSQIEQEMDYKLLTSTERKLGYKIRFNLGVLLKTDQLTQCEVLCKYVQQGIYSLNTAKRILGIETLDKDVTVFPSGQVTLEQLMNNDVSYVKNSSKKVVEDDDKSSTG